MAMLVTVDRAIFGICWMDMLAVLFLSFYEAQTVRQSRFDEVELFCTGLQ